MWAKRQLVRSSRPQKAFVTLMTPCSHCVAKVGGSVRKGVSLVTRKTPCHAMSVGVLRCGKGRERCGRREIRCNTAATKVKQVDGGMVWLCRAKGGCRQSKKPGRPGGTGKQLLGGGGSICPSARQRYFHVAPTCGERRSRCRPSTHHHFNYYYFIPAVFKFSAALIPDAMFTFTAFTPASSIPAACWGRRTRCVPSSCRC